MNVNNKFPWWKPNNYKKKYINGIIKNINKNQMSMGIECRTLELELKKTLNSKYIVLTNSGTSALMMAFLALGLKKNTKILCTDMTWTATINPALIVRANIKLVDINHFSQNVSYKKLNKEIKKFKPDIVMLVHLNGEVTYNHEFEKLKTELKFRVIEDSAQAFLSKSAENIYGGTKYEIGCFSLSITKTIHMVYGGFCSTNSKFLAKKLIQIRNNGVDETKNNYLLGNLKTYGSNFKPSNLHATIGLINLKKKKEIIKKIKKINLIYSKNIDNKKILFLHSNHKNYIPLYNLAIVKLRKKFIKFCAINKIGLHLNYRALHESKLFFKTKKFLNSKFISKFLVRLPSGPGYSYQDIKKIIKIINKF